MKRTKKPLPAPLSAPRTSTSAGGKVRLVAACALLALAGTSLHAQVYRITGPDGRVTFSDKPPPDPAKAAVGAGGSGAAANAGAGLPFELRQIVGRYPVTLYTAPSCAPCGSARALLTMRGVPYVEKTVSTNEDGAALQRLAGDNVLPFVTIGSQQIKGFSDVEWSQYLDVAGYPKASILPPSWRNPPTSPLVAVQKPASPDATAAASAAKPASTLAAPSPPPPRTADNPAGIRF